MKNALTSFPNTSLNVDNVISAPVIGVGGIDFEGSKKICMLAPQCQDRRTKEGSFDLFTTAWHRTASNRQVQQSGEEKFDEWCCRIQYLTVRAWS